MVLTQPDRPSGRGLRSAPSAVKRLALERGLSVDQPSSLADPAVCDRVRDAGADFLVVAAYGLILPVSVLALSRFGPVNIHASLLPRWRGAAPIQRALMAGDPETGVSLMRMEAGLDTGPVFVQARVGISPDDDAGSLHDKLAALGARMIVEALPEIAAGRLQPIPQPESGVTYARKIEKRDQAVDWRRPARDIANGVRALRPAPGATTSLRGEPLKIWHAVACDAAGPAGQVLQADAQGLVVGCGEGALRVTELQRAGGRKLSAAEFLRGFDAAPGEQLQ